MTLPDFSPGALALFLRGHLFRAGVEAAYLSPLNKVSASKAERRRVQKLARVSDAEWDAAWTGRLKKAAPRVRLWAAVGQVPGHFDVMLTDDGRQEFVGAAVRTSADGGVAGADHGVTAT